MDRFVSNFAQRKSVSCSLQKYKNGYHATRGCYGNGGHLGFWMGSRETSSGCNFYCIALCSSQNIANMHTCGMTKGIFNILLGYFFMIFFAQSSEKIHIFLTKKPLEQNLSKILKIPFVIP